jgi:O-antigen ligase
MNKNYFWLSLFFYGLMYLSFNVKSYILPSILIGIISFYFVPILKGKIKRFLFFVLLLNLPFERGIRGDRVVVVPNLTISNVSGYEFYFGLSLKIVFAITLLILTVKDRIRGNEFLSFNSVHHEDVLLLTFVLLSILSTYFALNANNSFLGLGRLLYSCWLFWLAKSNIFGKKFYKMFFSVLLAGLIFQGLIGSLQFLRNSYLGRYVEEMANIEYLPYGKYTYESKALFRSSGTTGDPTFFASLLTMYLPVVLAVYLQLNFMKNWRMKRNIKIVFLIALVIGSVAEFATFSRSGWFITALSLGIIIMQFRSKINWSKFIASNKELIYALVVFLVIFSDKLIVRLLSIRKLFKYGTGKYRMELINEAVKIISSYPWFGVGLHGFTAAVMKNTTSILPTRFLFPVHNVFLIFGTEMGIPALVVFIFFVLTIIYKSFKQFRENPFLLGIWVACISYIFNAQFHPLFSQDATFDYFMLYLGVLSKRIKLGFK